MDGNGMLSQAEIDALLGGVDLYGGDTSTSDPLDATVPEPASEPAQDGYVVGTEPTSADDAFLNDVEKDAIGEVANISMGSSATTLYSLVNRKVNITTPVVTLASWESLLTQYEKPCVFIQIKYTQGLDGSNILVLRETDVKIITDLMMGGDGTNTEGEIGELHLSAISEAMNQMMGSSATSLSTMLGNVIDISPPDANLLNLTDVKDGSTIAPFLGGTFVKIEFRMQIGDLVDSTIMQLYPIEFAKKIVETFIGGGSAEEEPAPAPEPAPASMGNDSGMNMGMNPNMGMNMGMNPNMGMDPNMGMNMGMDPNMGMNMGMNPNMGMNMGMNPNMGMNMGMNPNMGMNMGMNPNMGMNMGMNPNMGMPFGFAPNNMQNVNVQPAQFQNFSNDVNAIVNQENIGLIMDVPLEVTVELGRTTKSISDILEFAPGTIIELNRIAGEPIDVLVNGKFVARGEVVVIEENFGIRVTEIIK